METNTAENVAHPEYNVIVTENVLDQHYQYLKDPSAFKVYRQRWTILFIIAVINFTNALIWIMFSPVTDMTSKYYGISFMDVNWLSLVYLVASIPSGFFASWMLDSMGLRASIILAACFNFIGSGLRNLTVFSFIPSHIRFPLLIGGQVIAACGQTFIMFTPAKVAALWFGDNQRAIATTIASMSNPLGILAANILSPALVKKEDDLKIMLWLCSAVSLTGVILSLCFVRSSLPPTPPSPSAAAQSEPFFIGIKKLRTNYQFWLLAFSIGGGLALFTANTTFLEQILCPQNYDNNFAGLCGALMIAAGAVGAVIAGVIADKTKKFSEVTKIGFCLSTLCGIAFVQMARLREQAIAVATSITLFGFFGFAIYPTSLEMAVELTYPVAEATSTGIIFLSGQIQGIVFMLLAQYTAQPLSSHAATLPKACPSTGEFDPQDWTIPNLIINGVGVLYCIVITLLFRAKYRRMEEEIRIKAGNTLQGKLDSPVNYI
ncbi:unnamed protein product [Lymnaea stagnalis]|uniref:Major facilitator superfamily (MFS) profile domain-containing protein n=1 Tax=Lymnaea stagnalis TaxID=6523 RepID=A0AAV2I0Z3_LYMST